MKESKYDVDFFKSFDVVMNGLDNLEARRHVNRLCLAAETPLIESGTAGYLGQVSHPALTNVGCCLPVVWCWSSIKAINVVDTSTQTFLVTYR